MEALDSCDFDRREVAGFYDIVNRFATGDHLSDPNATELTELNDEVVALLALYVRTRTRSDDHARSAIDMVGEMLTHGGAETTKKLGLESGQTVYNRRRSVGVAVAKQLDILCGETPTPPPERRRVSRPRATTSNPSSRPVSNRNNGTSTRREGALPDSAGLYLRDIGRVQLLSAEDEVELSKRIEAGLAAQAVMDGRIELAAEPDGAQPLDPELAELEWLAADGQQAFRDFAAANTRLAVSVAKKYTRNYANTSLGFEDLIQAANESLLRAVQKFDYKKGNKFSTYATYWLKQGVQRLLAKESRTIRLPIHTVAKLNQVTKFSSTWLNEKSSLPTINEIASGLDMKPDAVKELLDLEHLQPDSLNRRLGHDGDAMELGDILPASQLETDMDEDVAQDMLRDRVRSVLDTMKLPGKKETQQRDLYIFVRLCGAADGQPPTLDDVGRTVGLTRERVRQIRDKMIRHMRASPELRQLYDEMS